MNSKLKLLKNISAFSFLFILLLSPLLAFSQETTPTYKIVLAVLKDNPDYYAARAGFVNYLEEQDDVIVEFKVIDASGDMSSYEESIHKLKDDESIDLIFSTGTRSTIPISKIIKNIPVVFTAVTAPVESKIVADLRKPGGNITGTHCSVPTRNQVKAIKEVMPNIKKLGIIYTAEEPNAEIQTNAFIREAEKQGLTVLLSTVSKNCKTQKEVATATEAIINQVDIIIGLQDTSISRYGKGMIKISEKYKTPTYVTLTHLIQEGAVFSMGVNFSKLGNISAKQTLQILRDNIPAGEIPVLTQEDYPLTINLLAADEMGINIPVEVLRTSNKYIK